MIHFPDTGASWSLLSCINIIREWPLGLLWLFFLFFFAIQRRINIVWLSTVYSAANQWSLRCSSNHFRLINFQITEALQEEAEGGRGRQREAGGGGGRHSRVEASAGSGSFEGVWQRRLSSLWLLITFPFSPETSEKSMSLTISCLRYKPIRLNAVCVYVCVEISFFFSLIFFFFFFFFFFSPVFFFCVLLSASLTLSFWCVVMP